MVSHGSWKNCSDDLSSIFFASSSEILCDLDTACIRAGSIAIHSRFHFVFNAFLAKDFKYFIPLVHNLLNVGISVISFNHLPDTHKILHQIVDTGFNHVFKTSDSIANIHPIGSFAHSQTALVKIVFIFP